MTDTPTARVGPAPRPAPQARIHAHRQRPRAPSGTTSRDHHSALIDVLVLAAVVGLSTVTYVSQIGFYSDDWTLLASFVTHGDLSAAGGLTEFMRARPTQVVQLTLMFQLFGLAPLGYHLVNAVVLVGMVLLAYFLLTELGMARPLAVAVTAVFGLLPHYSTNRFWFSAFPYVLGMALLFLSVYGDLRALRGQGAAIWRWKATALVCLLVASLGHEIVIPLLAVAPFVVWIRARQMPQAVTHRLHRSATAFFYGSNIVLLAVVVGFKSVVAVGTGVSSSYALHLARIALGSVAVNYGSLGVTLHHAARWSLNVLSPATLVLAAGVAALVYIRLVSHGWEATPRATRSTAVRLAAAGLMVFGLGYAIFLVTGRILFTSTGIGNRVNMAAALGVAMTFVALLLGASGLLRQSFLRRHGFAAGVAALCFACFLVTNALAVQWARAWDEQVQVLDGITDRFPSLPPNTTLVLDGVCPYVGPGIIFESYWDLAGALRVHYGDPTLRADVTSGNFEVGEAGLMTRMYADKTATHEYGRRLIVYNAGTGRVRPLTDFGEARRYFSQRTEPVCPQGAASSGVTILDIDSRYQRLERQHLWG